MAQKKPPLVRQSETIAAHIGLPAEEAEEAQDDGAHGRWSAIEWWRMERDLLREPALAVVVHRANKGRLPKVAGQGFFSYARHWGLWVAAEPMERPPRDPSNEPRLVEFSSVGQAWVLEVPELRDQDWRALSFHAHEIKMEMEAGDWFHERLTGVRRRLALLGLSAGSAWLADDRSISRRDWFRPVNQMAGAYASEERVLSSHLKQDSLV